MNELIEKTYTYESLKKEKHNLRGPQIALLRVAEHSLQNGELEQAMDLYKKLTNIPNINAKFKNKLLNNVEKIIVYLDDQEKEKNKPKDTYEKINIPERDPISDDLKNPSITTDELDKSITDEISQNQLNAQQGKILEKGHPSEIQDVHMSGINIQGLTADNLDLNEAFDNIANEISKQLERVVDAKLRVLDNEDYEKIDKQNKNKYQEKEYENTKDHEDFQATIKPKDINLDKDFFQNIQIMNSSDINEQISSILNNEYPDLGNLYPEITNEEIQSIKDLKDKITDITPENIINRLEDVKRQIETTSTKAPTPIIYKTPLSQAIIEADTEEQYYSKLRRATEIDKPQDTESNISKIEEYKITKDEKVIIEDPSKQLDQKDRIINEIKIKEAQKEDIPVKKEKIPQYEDKDQVSNEDILKELSSLKSKFNEYDLPSQEEIEDLFSEEIISDEFDAQDAIDKIDESGSENLQDNIDQIVTDNLQHLLEQQKQINKITEKLEKVAKQQNEIAKSVLSDEKLHGYDILNRIEKEIPNDDVKKFIDTQMDEISEKIDNMLSEQEIPVESTDSLKENITKKLKSDLEEELKKESKNIEHVESVENLQEKLDNAMETIKSMQNRVDNYDDRFNRVENKISIDDT